MRWFLLSLVSVALIGCGDGWRTEYSSAFAEIQPAATYQCEQFGQQYMKHYYNPGEAWHVLCIQKSPDRIIDKVIPE